MSLPAFLEEHFIMRHHVVFCAIVPPVVRRFRSLAIVVLSLLSLLLGGMPWFSAAHAQSFSAGASRANLSYHDWLYDHAGCARGVPRPLSWVVWTGRNGRFTPREVALTFDDGPTPYSSPSILGFLERTHTPATFLVEGQYAARWPQYVRREWHDGFAIGMHTWDHPDMTRQSDAGLAHQFGDTLAAVRRAIGVKSCLWFWRPPYGAYNQRVVSFAARYGLTTLTWDDDSRDWTRPGAAAIAQTVLREAHAGAIILMHDGPAMREQTAQALPLILAGLRKDGLRPVTVPQLLADAHFPGVYTTPAA
jgi:peptidoglycan/xylan/chitin deacetylase (PgdA/CDA1 family)